MMQQNLNRGDGQFRFCAPSARYPPPNYCGPYLGDGSPVNMWHLDYAIEGPQGQRNAELHRILSTIHALTLEFQKLRASFESTKGQVDSLEAKLIRQGEKDEEARNTETVVANARYDDIQLQVLALTEKEKENTNSLVEMWEKLSERLDVVGSEVARLAGGEEEMNEQADPLGRIAIQEQAPQASGKAEEPKSSKAQARKSGNVMNRLGQVNPVGSPPLVATSNRFGRLALQGKDSGLDGIDAGEPGWERVSKRMRGGNQRNEIVEALVESTETHSIESLTKLVETGLRNRLKAKLQVLEVRLLQSRVPARARPSVQKPHIVTSAHVSIKVPSRLRVRWSWKNAHGIRAVDDDEKSWFGMRLWVPKGKGTNGQAQAQRKVEAEPPPNKGLTKLPAALAPAPRVGKDRQATKGGGQAQAKNGSPQVTRVSAREDAAGEGSSDQTAAGLRNKTQSVSPPARIVSQGEAKRSNLEVEGPGIGLGGMGGLGGEKVLVEEVVGSEELSEAWHVSPLFAETTPPPPSPGPPRQSPELVRQAPQPLDGAKRDASVPESRMTLRPRLQTSSQIRGTSQVLEAAAFGSAAGVRGGIPPPPPPPSNDDTPRE